MKTASKKLLSLILALVMVMSVLPAGVLADETGAGPCDLTALTVGVGKPKTTLTLNPKFSKDVTEYTVDTREYPTYPADKACAVKATAASGATITAQLNSAEASNVESGSTSWKKVAGSLEPGTYNVLKITVAASTDEGAESKTYTVTIPMNGENNSAPVARTLTSIAITTPPIKTEYNVNESFSNSGMVVTAYYSNGSEETVPMYTMDPMVITADTKEITIKYNGKTAKQSITVNVPVTGPNATITIPSGATLFVGQKGTTHYIPFTAVELNEPTANGDGTATYSFDLKPGEYNYRVSGDNYVTYAGMFTKSSSNDSSLTLSAAQLNPSGKSKTTVDRSLSSNSGYNVADIYLNINPQNYLKLANGATYQLVNLRSWQATDTVVNNYFIEPDYHYTVIDESGRPSDVVTVSASGLVTAQKSGTAIVLVTYDAINVNGAAGGPFFGAIWPENTGVFVVSVGAGSSGINTGMTMNAGKNTTANKLSGDALDSEHDVIYFTGDKGGYTFAPGTAGCSVSAANPTVGTAMSFSGFAPVSANSDGSFTVPLTQGRNIVKISKDGKAEYQVITAKKVTVTVNGGDPVHPGDPVTIKFDTVYHPAGKLAGVYNMGAVIEYTSAGGAKTSVGGASDQYKFASTAACQTVSGELKRTESVSDQSFVSGVNYTAEGTITVPADYSSDTFTLSGGAIIADGFGDPYGNHRSISLNVGRDPNFNASIRKAWLGQLPDIVIPIVISEAEVTGISLDTTNVKTAYWEGDNFDAANLAVTAKYSDGKTGTVNNYTVTPSVLTARTEKVTVTYNGHTAEIPVKVTALEAVSIAITTPPSQTAYTAGSVFNPTGMVVTATYNSGETKAIGGYTFAPARELALEDTLVTVTYGGLTATTSITVTPAASGENSSITVSFTLLGDELHGAPTAGTGTHTLRDENLTPWIAESSVTVPQGSKVLDVFSKTLGLAGIPFENRGGNYISSIRGLAEFSNGQLSGWMYTLNGVHPNLGVAEQIVSDGDVIVFHYTDDYTRERGSENWTSGGGSGSGADSDDKAETTLSPEVTANSRGEASAVIGEDELKNAVAEAKTERADTIVIAPEVKGDADKVSVELPKSGVDSIAKQTDADLKVETGIADITVPQKSLDGLAAQPGSKVIISTKAVKGKDDVKLEVAVDGKAVEKLSGGIGVSVPARDGNSGNVLVIVKADGTEEIVKKSIVDGRRVEAILDGSCTVRVVDNSKRFDDTVNHWGKDAVAFASSHELFTGTGANTFSPNTPMSRAMLATVLYRLEDAAASGSNPFGDVPNGAWYTDAVTWASNAGIVTGTGSGFNPNGSVSREQLAAMLCRYAKTLGMSTGAAGDLSRFNDGDKTSAWAKDAMSWAVGSGLISGKGSGVLDPAGSATRAEVAVIMQRLIGLMVK